MSDLRMTTDVENVKKMSTFPNRDDWLSAEQVKARFDQAAVDIKQHINEVIVPAIEENQTITTNAVLFSEQFLKKEQQEQARANIGAAKSAAVLYEYQALSDEQKAVARANINAVDASKTVTSVDGITPAAGNVPLAAVQYAAAQQLSAQEQETARKNIGAVSTATHIALQNTVQALENNQQLTDYAMRIIEHTVSEKVSFTSQTLTGEQKEQARENIGAAPSGYGWGENRGATMPGDDADLALTTGLYRVTSSTVNTPDNCNLVFVQAAASSYIYQTAYCADGTVAMRVNDHDSWSEWQKIGKKEKVYEHIATITVAPDADGSLPQHVIFSADSEGNAFKLKDFMVKAYAGFVDGAQSMLYMNVNGAGVIVNGAVGSISSACRSFNVFFRLEDGGFKRVEYTSSIATNNAFNAQAAIEQSRLIPPTFAIADPPITKIDLFTNTGTNKAWVEGSTFELWGVRV